MSKVINLRTVRKQQARDTAQKAALRTSKPGAEAGRRQAQAALERARLEAHRRDLPKD